MQVAPPGRVAFVVDFIWTLLHLMELKQSDTLEVPTSTFLKISLLLMSVMAIFFLHWLLLCWFFLLLHFTGDLSQVLIRFQSFIHVHSVLEKSYIWLSFLFKWFTNYISSSHFFQTSSPYSQLSDGYFQVSVLWFLQIQQFLKSNLFFSHPIPLCQHPLLVIPTHLELSLNILSIPVFTTLVHCNFSCKDVLTDFFAFVLFPYPWTVFLVFSEAVLLPGTKFLNGCPLPDDESQSLWSDLQEALWIWSKFHFQPQLPLLPTPSLCSYPNGLLLLIPPPPARQATVAHIQSLLCVRHYVKCFKFIISFNPHNKPDQYHAIIILIV